MDKIEEVVPDWEPGIEPEPEAPPVPPRSGLLLPAGMHVIPLDELTMTAESVSEAQLIDEIMERSAIVAAVAKMESGASPSGLIRDFYDVSIPVLKTLTTAERLELGSGIARYLGLGRDELNFAPVEY